MPKVFFFLPCWCFRDRLFRGILTCLKFVLQSTEECTAIKEKVKKFIAEWNAHEGAAGSGSSDADMPSTPAAEIPAGEGTGGPSEDAAQDGVAN